MTIVMGLDQHRAQITADWLDTETGEVKRGRVAPADRAGRAQVLGRFRRPGARGGVGGDDGLAVRGRGAAAVGAVVHLAEPAETAARRGPKKRAKTDRADARHLRELLMIERLPESWIPPDHILDLRAGSGCGTRSLSSARSGSSGSRRCSITTAARSAGS